MKDMYLLRNFTGNQNKDMSNRILFNFKWSDHGYTCLLTSKGWIPQTFKYVRDDVVFQEWIDSKPRESK